MIEMRQWILRTACGAALATLGAATWAQVGPEFCGPLSVPGQYGPYDYRTDKDKLPVVENAHFTPSIEMLVRGRTGLKVGPDLSYTLEKFPNHHRALSAVSKLSQRKQELLKAGLLKPVECFFERALRFRPDDNIARMLYSQYLIQENRPEDAQRQLRAVVAQAGDNLLTHQNAGLIYLELKDFERARAQAWRVLPFSGSDNPLIDALKAAGEWREPPPEAAASAEPAASEAATQ